MQQRKSTFSILFFIKRQKLLKNGDAPVYMRVTVDGRFLEASLKRGVNPKTWNEKKQRSTGRDRLSLELNDYLDDTLAKILKIHQRFADEKKIINPKTILDEWTGRIEKPKMLCEEFRADNEKYRQRLEIGDVVLNTVLRNERAERYLGEFIRKKYKAEDIPFSAIDNAFVRDFHLFLRVDKKQEQNTANKYCKILKRIVTLALDNKWMEVNPFQGVRFQAKATNRQFLTEKELSTIMNKTFTLDRLNVVRDIFVFCALTGLSFSDVEGLKPEHVSVDDDGNYWIHKARQKTKNVCSIPYLESARAIAEKIQGASPLRETRRPTSSHLQPTYELLSRRDSRNMWHKQATHHAHRAPLFRLSRPRQWRINGNYRQNARSFRHPHDEDLCKSNRQVNSRTDERTFRQIRVSEIATILNANCPG